MCIWHISCGNVDDVEAMLSCVSSTHISCGIVDDVEAMLKCESGTSRVELSMMWRLC